MKTKKQERLAQPVKGMRDHYGVEADQRQWIRDTLSKVFRKYGFSPLETPTLERSGNLTGHYGEEGEKLVFHVLKSGEYLEKVPKEHGEENLGEIDGKALRSHISDKALRYDLTLPLARFVAGNLENTFPLYKRYQIGNVFRAENPQLSRYREFTQCDADIVGSDNIQCEVELLLLLDESFRALGLKDYTLSMNNRALCNLLAKAAGAQNETDTQTIFSAIDYGRMRPDLLNRLTEDCRDKVKYFDPKTRNDFWSVAISKVLGEEFSAKLKTLDTNKVGFLDMIEVFDGDNLEIEVEKVFAPFLIIVNSLERLGRQDILNHLVFDFDLTRGLDYYTGIVFEANASKSTGERSVLGGGRYDNLISKFSNHRVPGVGLSFGLERIHDFLLSKKSEVKLPFHVLVINETISSFEGLHATQELRKAGIRTTLYFDNDTRIRSKLKYATKRGYSWILLLDEEDRKKDVYKLRPTNDPGTEIDGETKDRDIILSLHVIIDFLKKDSLN